jgi:hypothetical protein
MRKTKSLINGNHQLLSVKEVMDKILKEADGLPDEIRQMILKTRDAAWSAFVEEQEGVHSSHK